MTGLEGIMLRDEGESLVLVEDRGVDGVGVDGRVGMIGILGSGTLGGDVVG